MWVFLSLGCVASPSQDILGFWFFPLPSPTLTDWVLQCDQGWGKGGQEKGGNQEVDFKGKKLHVL